MTIQRSAAMTIGVAVLLSTSAATAQPLVGSGALPQDPALAAPPPTPATQRYWYGWQTLLAYTASTGMVGGGLAGAFRQPEPGWISVVAIGGTGIIFSGPIVHWAHGELGKGFAVLGINLGAIALGAGIGAGIGVATASGGTGEASGENRGIGAGLGAAFGGGLGSIASMITDVAALSYTTPSGPPTAVRQLRTLFAAPTFSVQPGRVSFGIAGTF